MKIALLSNVNIDILAQQIDKSHEIFLPSGYNTWIQEILDPKSGLHDFQPDIFFVLIDGNSLLDNIGEIGTGKNKVDEVFQYLDNIAHDYKNSAFFIATIDLKHKRILSIKSNRYEKDLEWYWYDNLRLLSEKFVNVFIFDLKELVEELGREQFYSSKMWYLGSIPYSMKGFTSISTRFRQYVNAWSGNRRKCLLLDLDNTLWGGVIGEDGLSGIRLSESKEGSQYRDLQQRIKEIKKTGILLGVVSKNNMDDAIQPFQSHPSMVLKEDDFVAFKANWNPKSENISELAKELNLGKDSFVFLDDNAIEREAVSVSLPTLKVLDFPKDTTKLEKIIIESYYEYFLALKTTEEDRQKTEAYRIEQNRKLDLIGANSIEDYIKSLNIEIDIHKISPDEIDRVHQLVQKTNQFNLTSKRYSLKEIGEMILNPKFEVFVAYANDRYGSYGLVSVVILSLNKDVAEVDTLLMSCRVMGRNIEVCIISELEKYLKEKGVSKIKSQYLKTTKNEPVRLLFDKLQYGLVSEDSMGNKKYCLELLDPLPERNNLCKVNFH